MRKVFLETHILLSDFFHRYPDYGFMRNPGPEDRERLIALREKIHENLQKMSLEPDVAVYTSVPALSRVASLLSEWKVPGALIREEISHWLSNLVVLDVKSQHLEAAVDVLSHPENQSIPFDEILNPLLCRENGISEIFSIV
jgi:hypothetical protein